MSLIYWRTLEETGRSPRINQFVHDSISSRVEWNTGRFHRTLKVALAARMDEEGESWFKALLFVLMGIRVSIPSLSGASFSLLVGRVPRLPMSLTDSSDAPKDRDLSNKVGNIKHIPPRIIS
uniref:Uncharacterized protein n=1 Tax=Lepeophtheirus salmonis TaxID=72036 RepID=A0A0K2THD6_LEPSM